MYNDYGYGYDAANAASDAAILGGLLVYTIIILVITVITVVSLWKIFSKADEPGWAAIVPFYNMYILFKITWGNGIMFLLMCIPFVNVVIQIITMVKLGQAFDRGTGFIVGLVLVPYVFYPILAFGSSEYVGIE